VLDGLTQSRAELLGLQRYFQAGGRHRELSWRGGTDAERPAGVLGSGDALGAIASCPNGSWLSWPQSSCSRTRCRACGPATQTRAA